MRIFLTTSPRVNEAQKKPGRKPTSIARGLLPPLGIGYIAAVLEEHGHTVKIVDSPAFQFGYEDVVNQASSFQPDLIGLSVMTPHAPQAFELCKRLHAKMETVPIILGGPHPTCFPQECFSRFPQLTATVHGEGEFTTLEIVDRLSQGQSLRGVPNTTVRVDNEILENEIQKISIDLEKIPFPARHLYDIGRYAPEPFENKRLPSTNIIASRGCTYARCTFCYRSGKLKRAYRTQSPEKTIVEIKQLVERYNIKELVFYDDDILSNKKWTFQFCDLFEKENFDIVQCPTGI